ncbi:hypothetical protein [Lysinibacillus sp. 54212]|uniref:hypothetical protein n=1 Tax=Lysinibacillus sp. 54212 TaxID=3119829 RepID=UPI002FC9E493
MSNDHPLEEENFESFNPYFSDIAKIGMNVNVHGVSFVGNSEGYLALSRFFKYLAKMS